MTSTKGAIFMSGAAIAGAFAAYYLLREKKKTEENEPPALSRDELVTVLKELLTQSNDLFAQTAEAIGNVLQSLPPGAVPKAELQGFAFTQLGFRQRMKQLESAVYREMETTEADVKAACKFYGKDKEVEALQKAFVRNWDNALDGKPPSGPELPTSISANAVLAVLKDVFAAMRANPSEENPNNFMPEIYARHNVSFDGSFQNFMNSSLAKYGDDEEFGRKFQEMYAEHQQLMILQSFKSSSSKGMSSDSANVMASLLGSDDDQDGEGDEALMSALSAAMQESSLADEASLSALLGQSGSVIELDDSADLVSSSTSSTIVIESVDDEEEQKEEQKESEEKVDVVDEGAEEDAAPAAAE